MQREREFAVEFFSWKGREKEIEQVEKDIFGVDFWSEKCIRESAEFPLFLGEVGLCFGKISCYYGMNIIIGEGYIANIAVAREFQGRGLGNLAMERLLQEAEKKGAKSITLEVRISNKKAINLYEKHGFVASGERKNFYSDGETALIMWRKK